MPTLTLDIDFPTIPHLALIKKLYKEKEFIDFLVVGENCANISNWLYYEVLTANSACLDIVTQNPDEDLLYLSNTEDSRIHLYVGSSSEQLPLLQLKGPITHYDLVYLHGHQYGQVLLQDMILSWNSLKINGLLCVEYDNPWISKTVSVFEDEYKLMYDKVHSLENRVIFEKKYHSMGDALVGTASQSLCPKHHKSNFRNSNGKHECRDCGYTW